MGSPPICECGTVKFWQGVVQSPENSQMITDWYSASHLIHGLLFYFFAHILWRRWKVFGGLPAKWALPIAVAFEGFWEILENSPIIINRYPRSDDQLGLFRRFHPQFDVRHRLDDDRLPACEPPADLGQRGACRGARIVHAGNDPRQPDA